MKRSSTEETQNSLACKSSKIMPTAAPFSSESLVIILSFLDDGKDVVSASMVSTQWCNSCADYQETIWRAVCSNCLSNLEKYPFMKNTKNGDKFEIQAYEGIYSTWKETFVKM